MQTVDLNKYSEFVEKVTSKDSNSLTDFMNRLNRLDANYEAFGPNGEMQHGPDINVPLLITAGIGLSSESGEFSEIVKKLLFHGKPLNKENYDHMVSELGDVIWYWTNACRALGVNPNDVVAQNVAKLEARYPGGKFNTFNAEIRAATDK